MLDVKIKFHFQKLIFIRSAGQVYMPEIVPNIIIFKGRLLKDTLINKVYIKSFSTRHFKVAGTGPGISQAIVDKVFQPFFKRDG